MILGKHVARVSFHKSGAGVHWLAPLLTAQTSRGDSLLTIPCSNCLFVCALGLFIVMESSECEHSEVANLRETDEIVISVNCETEQSRYTETPGCPGTSPLIQITVRSEMTQSQRVTEWTPPHPTFESGCDAARRRWQKAVHLVGWRVVSLERLRCSWVLLQVCVIWHCLLCLFSVDVTSEPSMLPKRSWEQLVKRSVT